MLRRLVAQHNKEVGAVLHIEAGVVDYGWRIGEAVFVLTPDELTAMLEEARAEVPEGFSYENVQPVRIAIMAITRCNCPTVALNGDQWRCTYEDNNAGAAWCESHGIDKAGFGPTPLTATQSLLAAVQAAAEEKPVPDDEPELDIETAVRRGIWEFSRQCRVLDEMMHSVTASLKAAAEKPTSAMSIEECAEECRNRDPYRFPYKAVAYKVPRGCTFQITNDEDDVIGEEGIYYDTCLEAWQAAAAKLRKQATSPDA